MVRGAVTDDTGQADISSDKVCPKCGSAHVHRSRRRYLEKWFSWLHTGQRTFRCYDCQHRCWDYKRPDLSGRMPAALQASGDHTDKTGSRKKHRKRHKRSDGITPYRRFREWLYRKHSLTVGMLLILVLLICLALFLVILGLEQMT